MGTAFKRKYSRILAVATTVSIAVAGMVFVDIQNERAEELKRMCMGDQGPFCREPVSFSLTCNGDEDVCAAMDKRIDEDPRFYRVIKGSPDVNFKFHTERSAVDQKISGMKVWSSSEKVIFKRPIEGISSGPGEELPKRTVHKFHLSMEVIK